MMIDRHIAPDLFIAGKPPLTPPQSLALDNGLPLFLISAGTKEVTKLEFVFEAGLWYEDSPLQAALANAMLQEGSTQFTSAQIAELFDFHGAYLQLMADQHFGILSVISLNKHLPKLLEVVEDIIKNSVFPEKEFQTLVKQRKQRFLLENEKVKVLCQKKFSEVLFGVNHPYSQTVKATDFDALKSNCLRSFYKQNYRSNKCRIIASGKIDADLPELLNRYFGQEDWNGQPVVNRENQIIPSTENIHRAEKSGAIQTAIRIGKMMVAKDHIDFPGLQLLITILGGYFSSRLMANIREEKGYTYGIGASLLSFRNAGYLVIATETDKRNEEATIREIFFELKKLREELVGNDEMERVRQYLLGEFIRDFDGPFAQEGAFRSIHDFGLNYEFYETYYETLLNITPEKIRELAANYLDESSFYTVVAGSST